MNQEMIFVVVFAFSFSLVAIMAVMRNLRERIEKLEREVRK